MVFTGKLTRGSQACGCCDCVWTVFVAEWLFEELSHLITDSLN